MSSTSCTLSQSANAIKEVIDNSRKFLKIVTFRFDSREFGDLIIERAKNNVDVEIITNPPDNVARDSLRPIVESMYEDLKTNHVTLHLCQWEAGEPRLTTTSMSGNQSAGIGEKWYSLHMQILINENEVLVTSRPLTADQTIDVFYRSSEARLIEAALSKVEEIKRLFLEPRKVADLTILGEATNFLGEKTFKETIALFRATGRLNAKEYELGKLPKHDLANGLIISPFDGKMRNLLYDFIDSADNFLYFFLETFFDEDLIGKLQEKVKSNPDIAIQIITCPPEKIRQSPQKARELVSQALSLGIQVGNISNIQAKFWLSDKWLAISSGDFNRMNLGHSTSSLHWKADTQLLLLDNNPELIRQMKKTFVDNFYEIDQGKICIKDVLVLVKRMAKHDRLSGSTDACKYLSRFKASLMIKTEQDVRYVAATAISLAKIDGKIKLEGQYMLMAIIIYQLQRREHKLDEIVEKLSGVESQSVIMETVALMERKHQVIKSVDVYRIAPNIGRLQDHSQKSISKF